MNNNFNREGDCAKRGHVHIPECLPAWTGSPLEMVIGVTAIAICCGVSEATINAHVVRRQAVPAYRVSYGNKRLVAVKRADLADVINYLRDRQGVARPAARPAVAAAPVPVPVPARDALLSALIAQGGRASS